MMVKYWTNADRDICLKSAKDIIQNDGRCKLVSCNNCLLESRQTGIWATCNDVCIELCGATNNEAFVKISQLFIDNVNLFVPYSIKDFVKTIMEVIDDDRRINCKS